MTNCDRLNSGTFIMGMTSLTFTFMGLLFTYCLKSKCKKCECCGFSLERDIENEIMEEKIELQHNVDYAPTMNIR